MFSLLQLLSATTGAFCLAYIVAYTHGKKTGFKEGKEKGFREGRMRGKIPVESRATLRRNKGRR